MSGAFETVALLPELGFERADAGKMEDWIYHNPRLDFDVVVGPNRHFLPSLNFAGTYNDGRTMQALDFSIAEKTASREEALALIAYYLRGLPDKRVPQWVIEGWALQDHLPWRRT